MKSPSQSDRLYMKPWQVCFLLLVLFAMFFGEITGVKAFYNPAQLPPGSSSVQITPANHRQAPPGASSPYYSMPSSHSGVPLLTMRRLPPVNYDKHLQTLPTALATSVSWKNQPPAAGRTGESKGSLETIPRPTPHPTPRPQSTMIGCDLDQHLSSGMPANFKPWWTPGVVNPSLKNHPYQKIAVETLLIAALNQSPQIRLLSYVPLAEETRIQEAQAEFDRHAFAESKFIRTSDPVGNVLTTGGPPRFYEENWGQTAGLRRKTLTGGSIELSQRIGYQDNNSTFFIPENQGNAKLVMNFTQPLLRGSGKTYNASHIMLAEIDTGIAWEKFSAGLQSKLVEVTRNYWQLYMDRAVLRQRQRLYQQACDIYSELKSRQTIDATRSQVFRAKASVAARYSDLARAQQNIKNTEAKIRELTGVTLPPNQPVAELIPVEFPTQTPTEIDPMDARRTALKHRPEMAEAVKAVRAASIRMDASRKDMLPTLDVVTEMYVAGIEGESNIGRALADQFSVGEPSYTVGLKFEVPLGRRGSKANYQRQVLELHRLTSQVDATALAIMTEVDIAVGEVNTLYREMQGKYNAMTAAEEDVNYLYQRWRFLSGEDRSASFILDELLDAQDRLAVEQVQFTQAQIGYTMTLVEMKRIMGVLLQYEEVAQIRTCEAGAPRLILNKPQLDRRPEPPPEVPQIVRPPVR